MKFIYPVPKPNGLVYEDGNAFQTQLQQELAGQYGYNPGNSSWHGGMHFSLKNAAHCQKDHPIIAIADGKIVAYRINNAYSTSEFRGLELPYSGDFCLIQHVFSYKEGEQEKHFDFYSLYMHLAPSTEENLSDLVENFQLPNWLYIEKNAEVTSTDGLRCRTDSLGKAGFVVSKGQKFSYDPRRLKSQVFGDKTRHFARCTLDPALNYGGSSITETWLCVDDDLVKTIGAKTVTQGALVELSGADQIDIKGGDAIGYLGQFHVATQIEAETPVADPRYQIHFELFSKEEPPEAFLKRFFGSANLDKVKKVEGDGSDGYLNLEEPNDFFKAFYQKVTLDESDVPGTEIAKNLSKWDSAQFMYHKHASEWYDKAAEKESIWETLLGKFTSPHFAELIEHEKERVDNLVWMQDASGLGLPKEVWNWWPIGHGVAFKAGCFITKDMLRKIWSRTSVTDDFLESVADEINEISVMVKLDTKLRLDHFFAQIRQEVGTSFKLEESFIYQESALTSELFSYYRQSEEHRLQAAQDAFPSTGAVGMTEEEKRAKFEVIANKIYGTHRTDQGNTEEGDGWRYRGRGLKQLTGKSNYRKITKWYNELWPDENMDFVANPDKLLETKYAVRSGALFWLNYKAWDKADKGSSIVIVDKVTEIVNKHTKSYKNRQDHFTLISKGAINSETGEAEGGVFDKAI